MIKSYSVGEYIDAWCTKCKLELGHTITAMVENLPKRVQCNTCNGQHNYRLKPEERPKRSTAKKSAKAKKLEKDYREYLSLLENADLATTNKYSIKGNFEKNAIINHVKFGTGVVMSVINANKVEVLFKDGPKLLTQNK